MRPAGPVRPLNHEKKMSRVFYQSSMAVLGKYINICGDVT